jgi:uncharacterized protein (DUF433 family)
MSAMSNLHFEIAEAIEAGHSFQAIAKDFDVPLSWVNEVYKSILSC